MDFFKGEGGDFFAKTIFIKPKAPNSKRPGWGGRAPQFTASDRTPTLSVPRDALRRLAAVSSVVQFHKAG